jgi:hypothetical protein
VVVGVAVAGRVDVLAGVSPRLIPLSARMEARTALSLLIVASLLRNDWRMAAPRLKPPAGSGVGVVAVRVLLELLVERM